MSHKISIGPWRTWAILSLSMVLVLAVFVLVAMMIKLQSGNVAKQTLIQVIEQSNLKLAQLIVNEIKRHHELNDDKSGIRAYFANFQEDRSHSLRSEAQQLRGRAAFDNLIKGMLEGTSVLKIKLYDRRGWTIYSTELAQIGEDYGTQPGVVSAMAGEMYSQLVFRPTFVGVRGLLQDQTLVQSYIPITGFNIVNAGFVFEIYTDVSEQLNAVQAAEREIDFWMWTMMGVLFFLVLALSAWTGRQLRADWLARQSEAKESRERELQIEKEKSEFLAIVAHELRTPMASVLGFSEILCEREFDRARLNEICGYIVNESREMTRLLNDLLDLSTIEQSPEMQMNMVVTDIYVPIKMAVDRLVSRSLAGRLVTNTEPELPKVLIDPGRIAQALANVLTNALKYSPPESEVKLEVFRDPAAPHGRVALQIQDQGAGMSAEEVSRMFDRFWRADSSGTVKGYGLGMAIVKMILDRHGAGIDVDSCSGFGTKITLWLPLPPAQAAH